MTGMKSGIKSNGMQRYPTARASNNFAGQRGTVVSQNPLIHGQFKFERTNKLFALFKSHTNRSFTI